MLALLKILNLTKLLFSMIGFNFLCLVSCSILNLLSFEKYYFVSNMHVMTSAWMALRFENRHPT